MHERQGSRGTLHRPTDNFSRPEITIESSISKRSLEQQAYGPFRNMSYTPQYQGRSGHPPELFKAPPERALRQILSVGGRLGHSGNIKNKGSLQDDSGMEYDDPRLADQPARREHMLNNQSVRQQYSPKGTATQQRLAREIETLKRQNESLKSDLQQARRQISQSATYHKTMEQRLIAEREETEKALQKMARKLADAEKKYQYCRDENERYGELIHKMESRITGLLEENAVLNSTIYRNAKKIGEFDMLQERLDKLRLEYRELERIVQQDTEDWEIHKELWLNEREYYKEIIRKLEFQLSLDN